MYHPGSYLVYPMPIHPHHHLPFPQSPLPPQQQQQPPPTPRPPDTKDPLASPTTPTAAFVAAASPRDHPGVHADDRSPGAPAKDSEEAATSPLPPPLPERPPPGDRGGCPPPRTPPPQNSSTPSPVSSRDLKFGVDRILSGEVSLSGYLRASKGSPRGCRPEGEEGSPVASDGGPLHSDDPTPHRCGSPSSPLSSPASSSSASPSLRASHCPSTPPPAPIVVPCPRGAAVLLRCNGEYPHPFGGQNPSSPSTPSFPPPPHSPFPSPSRPHLVVDHHPPPMGPCPTTGRPPSSPYAAAAAAAAAAAYSSYYPQLHQHHPGMIPYGPLYPPTGAMLGPTHLEEVSSGVGGPVGCPPIGSACIVPVSSGGDASAGGGGTNGGKRKRSWSRAVFSNLQRKGLEKRFQLQKYITKPDRRQLAATLGLTDAQVKVWFQNRRMKWRHSKEGKQPIAEPSASLTSSMPPPPASLHLLSSRDDEKIDHSPSTMQDPSFTPDWENQESRATDRPDSTQRGLEEEIRVDS